MHRYSSPPQPRVEGQVSPWASAAVMEQGTAQSQKYPAIESAEGRVGQGPHSPAFFAQHGRWARRGPSAVTGSEKAVMTIQAGASPLANFMLPSQTERKSVGHSTVGRNPLHINYNQLNHHRSKIKVHK